MGRQPCTKHFPLRLKNGRCIDCRNAANRIRLRKIRKNQPPKESPYDFPFVKDLQVRTAEEVAELTGMHVNSVKRICTRALKKISNDPVFKNVFETLVRERRISDNQIGKL
jgi:hypothetical protein